MIEFCWVACHAYMLYMTLGIIAGLTNNDTLKAFTHNRTAFYILWGMANGPFATATLAFRNALVLHDVPNLASAFIHLTPCSLCWTARWFQPRFDKAWPGVFDIPKLDAPLSEGPTLWDIWYPSYMFYLAWAVSYLAFMLLFGRHYGAPFKKWDTMFHDTMHAFPMMAKVCTYDESTDQKRRRCLPFIIFSLLHAAQMVIQYAISYVTYYSFWAHTALCLTLFTSASWYGALRYFNMMTKYYLKRIEKIGRKHKKQESYNQINRANSKNLDDEGYAMSSSQSEADKNVMA